VGVPYLTQEFTLLLKPPYDGLAARVIELEEDRMEELGCTGELIEYGLADLSIGPNTKGFLRYELEVVVLELLFGWSLLSHGCWQVLPKVKVYQIV